MEKETADETREKQCKTAKKGEDNKERKGNRQGRQVLCISLEQRECRQKTKSQKGKRMRAYEAH